jgi:hypothetical protein
MPMARSDLQRLSDRLRAVENITVGVAHIHGAKRIRRAARYAMAEQSQRPGLFTRFARWLLV